jgi:predicted nucleotidyltransferase/predicted DNA-binding transcriptional regulator
MKEKSLKLNKTEQLERGQGFLGILYWFFAYPDVKTTLSELAKEVGISKKTANRVVSDLVKEGFLVKEEIGKAWRIHCNLAHPYNTTFKIGHNLSLVYNSGIIPEVYKTVGNPKTIILFGSYRKGDDISSSDLDLAVEIVGDSDMKVITLGTIPLLGLRKNVRVNLHVFSRNKIDLNLFSNIANGIVIEGFLEVHP